MDDESQTITLLSFTTEIVSRYAGNNRIPAADLPDLVNAVYRCLSDINRPKPKPALAKSGSAVRVRKSLANPNFIVSMIDGQHYAMLSRHIKRHGYTPQSYRETFGLPVDYPMTASAYSEKRRSLAKKIGLGIKPTRPIASAADNKVPAIKPSPRPSSRKPARETTT